jgi:putative redox protein
MRSGQARILALVFVEVRRNMPEEMTAIARLDDGMRFDAEAGSGHHVTLDASAHSGGAGAGFIPMEMLLIGLAGCTGMDVISILRKKRQDVTAYEVVVHGVRAEMNPMVFTDITVEHRVTGRHISAEAVERAIELSETKYCGAGAMLGKTARLTHTFRIVAADEPLPAISSAGV